MVICVRRTDGWLERRYCITILLPKEGGRFALQAFELRKRVLESRNAIPAEYLAKF
jgi:hypothetical protein